MLGKRIKQKRTELGLSQRALAQKAGISQTHVYNAEKERTEVSRLALAALATALQTTVEELLGESPRPVGLTHVSGDLGREETQVVLAMRRLKKIDQRAVVRHAHGLELLARHKEEETPSPPGAIAKPDDKPPGLTPYIPPPRTDEPMVQARLIGYVAAGEPWPDGELNDEVSVPAGLSRPGAQVVKVRGHSLILDGVIDGDLLMIDPAEREPRKGDLVIAAIRDKGRWGMVVKRYGGQKGGIITLLSAHPEVKPIKGKDGVEIEVRAVVRHVWRS